MVRKLTACALAVSSFMFAGQLLAQSTFTMKIGAEFRSEYAYNNDGFNDPETPTSTINLNALKVKLYGNIGESTTFNFLINATPAVNAMLDTSDPANPTLHVDANLVEVAYLTHSFSDMFALRVGKDYLNFGGFERKRQNYKAVLLSSLVTENTLSAPAIEAHVSMGEAGKVVLQVSSDSRENALSGNQNQDQQPGMYLEYAGDFSGVKVLGQYGMFDKGYSNSWGLGVAVNMMNIDAAIDYNTLSVGYAADKDDMDVTTNVVVHAGYDMGKFMPWATYNYMDVEQETNVKDGGPADNQSNWAVGVTCTDASQAWHPYLAVVSHGFEAADSESDLEVKLGVNSEF